MKTTAALVILFVIEIAIACLVGQQMSALQTQQKALLNQLNINTHNIGVIVQYINAQKK